MGRPLYAESVARSLWETACGRRGTATGGNNGLGGTPPHTHCPASGSGSLNTQKTSKCTQILTVHTHALCIMCSSSISEWCQKQIRRHSERRTHLSVFVYLGQSVCAVQTRSVQGVCVCLSVEVYTVRRVCTWDPSRTLLEISFDLRNYEEMWWRKDWKMNILKKLSI